MASKMLFSISPLYACYFFYGNLLATLRINKLFLVDCQSDSDCGESGVCKEQSNSDYKRVCYCKFGQLGRNCEISKISFLNCQFLLASAFPSDDSCFNEEYLNASTHSGFEMYGLFRRECYRQKQLTEDDSLYSRVLNNNVEIIMDFKTYSYAAIGWRPTNIANECRSTPNVGMERGGFRKFFAVRQTFCFRRKCLFNSIASNVLYRHDLGIGYGLNKFVHSRRIFTRQKHSIARR